MTRPTHFRIEVLYQTLDGPACGNGAPGKLTDDPREVTCRSCRELCGFPVIDEAERIEEKPLGDDWHRWAA